MNQIIHQESDCSVTMTNPSIELSDSQVDSLAKGLAAIITRDLANGKEDFWQNLGENNETRNQRNV